MPLPDAYIINAQWLAAMPAMSFVALVFLNANIKQRALRKAQRGSLRISLLGGRALVLTWSTPFVRYYSAEQVASEYDALPKPTLKAMPISKTGATTSSAHEIISEATLEELVSEQLGGTVPVSPTSSTVTSNGCPEDPNSA